MNEQTRAQLLDLNRAFYEAHAEAFDRSRSGRPWPGWTRLLAELPIGPPPPGAGPAERRLGAVLDIGCGNGRFACFLEAAGIAFDYTGVDANAALLAAARHQLPPTGTGERHLIRADFLADGSPGRALPAGPFALVVLMGVLHHVPGADWRLALLRAAADRVGPGGCLAYAVWRFAAEPREQRKQIGFETLGPILGARLDRAELEPGDALLRFGSDPTAPPRYCHAVTDDELASWPGALGLSLRADFLADGPHGASNRYALLQRG